MSEKHENMIGGAGKVLTRRELILYDDRRLSISSALIVELGIPDRVDICIEHESRRIGITPGTSLKLSRDKRVATTHTRKVSLARTLWKMRVPLRAQVWQPMFDMIRHDGQPVLVVWPCVSTDEAPRHIMDSKVFPTGKQALQGSSDGSQYPSDTLNGNPSPCQARAIPNTAKETDLTPLHSYILDRDTTAAALLLDHGADANVRDSDGSTPLLYISVSELTEKATLLLDHGADVNACDVNGTTPLHMAARFGRVRMARLLLHRGADAEAQNASGLTPMHLAWQFGHAEVITLLQNRA